MIYTVEFNGHIIIEADTPEAACNKAQSILDSTDAYIYVENAEVY